MATDSKVFVILTFKWPSRTPERPSALHSGLPFVMGRAFLVELDVVCLKAPFAVVLILIVSLIGLFFTLDD